jgi:hypothetical protein
MHIPPLQGFTGKSRRDGDLLTVCFGLQTFSLRTILLPALVFIFCASLRAQVTIGGTDVPKPGAILDLNSTAKGGLVLSNVPLAGPDAIPLSFSGANAADPDVLKTGLTGSVIYNTNPAFCTGVHLWNGKHWGRITAETPVYTPGTLSITSGTDDLFGGSEVSFTAASGARIYRWYASINGDPYEYLGITTAPTFSEIFPAGNCRVKVIMDDCRSLKESNEVSFIMSSVSPAFGSLEGGNYIYIYGDFPYAASSDYAQAGLVSHYDGINNQGLGDKRHDYGATNWKDLKNPFYLPRYAGTGQWLSNGFQAFSKDTIFYSSTFPDTYPAGNHERTVEVIFRTPDASHMFEQELEVQRRIFIYGTYTQSHTFGVQYRGLKTENLSFPDVCLTGNKWVFYAIFGHNNNLVTCLSSTPSLETANTINTVTSTYRERMENEFTKSYINNIQATVAGIYNPSNTSLNTQQGPLIIGENLSHSTFLSVRLYDRVLNPEEIEHNADLDQIRFLAPPTVTIDGKACTETVVLSPHTLMCKVPEGNSTGFQNVTVNGAVYSGAYKYVDPVDDFYVSGISPIVGSTAGGGILTLTGKNLDRIGEVSLGGKTCSPAGIPDSETCQYDIPDNLPGEVDITITLIDGTVYRFAKVFEYQ